MKHVILFFGLLLGLSMQAFAQTYAFKGRVLDEKGIPLPGAFLQLKNTSFSTLSGEEGAFSIQAPAGTYQLLVSYIGMETVEMEISLPREEFLEIILFPESMDLASVEVVSTGYQQLPKERTTGSYAFLDAELVQRNVGPNVLNRLEDLTSGLIFNQGPQAANDPISIRGRSTIFSNTQPLIIVDNFPYDGEIENINPNEVASITVLKDAAASSIWGARAGNGVIVITTKRGEENQSMQVSLNANGTWKEPRDLFYVPQMSIPEFIGIEEQLFARNFYRSLENNANQPKLSPAIETLIALRDGKLSQAEADAQLAAFGNQDIRKDIRSHYLQPSFNQQYSLSIRGGGKQNSYMMSLGYDQMDSDVIGNTSNRWTLSAGNQWKAWKDKLEAGIQINMARQEAHNQTNLPNAYAYESLIDENGNPLSIAHTYSTRFLESLQGSGLLDWTYTPLEELGALGDQRQSLDFRISPYLNYNITKDLSLGLYYQYWSTNNSGRNRSSQELFYTRDLINKYTQVDETGNLTYPVPMGEILDVNEQQAYSHTFRPQLTYSKEKNNRHFWNVLAGAEIKDRQGLGYTDRFYGYRDDMGSSVQVDYISRFPMYFNPGSQVSILSNQSHSGLTDRFISYYANLGYDFQHKYFLTASARKDQSNIFGVETNQRGVPLGSIGGGWIISEEKFAQSPKMPFLKLRATYGFSGNVDKSLSSDVTAQYASFQFYDVLPQMRAAILVNPPNPDLRWEKIRMSNLAMDWETQNGFSPAVWNTIPKKQKTYWELIRCLPPQGKVALQETLPKPRPRVWI